MRCGGHSGLQWVSWGHYGCQQGSCHSGGHGGVLEVTGSWWSHTGGWGHDEAHGVTVASGVTAGSWGGRVHSRVTMGDHGVVLGVAVGPYLAGLDLIADMGGTGIGGCL